MGAEECHVCHGDRLKPEVLAIKVGDKNISELTRLSVAKSIEFLKILSFLR